MMEQHNDTVSQADVESLILNALKAHSEGLTDENLEQVLAPHGVSA